MEKVKNNINSNLSILDAIEIPNTHIDIWTKKKVNHQYNLLLSLLNAEKELNTIYVYKLLQQLQQDVDRLFLDWNLSNISRYEYESEKFS